MNLNQLIEAVSKSTGMTTEPVKKILEATISTLNNELQADEPIKLQGLGTLKKKPGKEGKEPKVVFRPWADAARKQKKKARKKERKAKKGAPSGAES